MKFSNRIFCHIILVLFLWPQIGYALPVEAETRDIVIYGGNQKINTASLQVKDANKEGNIVVVSGSEIADVKAKKARGEIQAWGYREKYEVEVNPNDTYYSNQWAMPKIDAPEAWDITTGSVEVVIAVADTGFNLTHPDLSAKFIAGYDYVDNDSNPALPNGGGDRYYHGTLVAGAAAAVTNNSVGVAGVDWNAKIMPLRVMDNNGGGYTDDIAAGIDYARINGANIINLSLGYHPDPGEDPDPVLEAAINNAYNAGVTVVAASGNENREVSYPAAFDNVIAVGATDQGDARCDEGDWGVGAGSNYGPELDIVAPGNAIYTTSVNWNGSSYVSGYASAGGTSLASPIVAGLAGLLESEEDYTPAEAKSLIENGAEKVAGMGGQNFTNYYGYGRINVNNSLGGQLSIDYSKIFQNTLRITIGDYSTPDPDDYLYQFSSPAIGEEITMVAAIRNDNGFPVTFDEVRIIGTYDNGIKFVVGSIPSFTVPANSIAVVPEVSYRITSFRTVYYYLDFIVEGTRKFPTIGAGYSPMRITPHFPTVKAVSIPGFIPGSTALGNPITGVFQIKNYDSRPAYLKSIRLRYCTSGLCWSFPNVVHELVPGETYSYSQATTPAIGGLYDANIRIIYGNGSLLIPDGANGASSYGYMLIY